MIAALALSLVAALGIVEPPPLAEISTPAEASAPAERLDPPPEPPVLPVVPAFSGESANGRCVGLEPLLAHFSPGWSVARMSAIAYRESRCQAGVRNRSSSATGLLQILASHCAWLSARMGEPCSRDRLTDPVYNVRAGAALYREQGIGAWAATS